MENEGKAKVLNSAAAPYTTGLSQTCGFASTMVDNNVPNLVSEPNYAVGTSGSNCVTGLASSGTGCIVNDNDFGAGNSLTSKSIFDLLGPNWKGYQEGMPSACSRASSGLYAYKHNPAAFYPSVYPVCQTNDVSFPAITCPNTAGATCTGTPSGSFVNDVSAGTLPSFSFVTPNLVNDMHNGPSISSGDNWLKTYIPLITAGPNYRNGDTAIFVMWDEADGTGGSTVTIPNVVIAPSVPTGTVFAPTINNAGFLHTTETLLGLTPYLGCASGVEPGTTTACPPGGNVDASTGFNLAPGATGPTPTPTPVPQPCGRAVPAAPYGLGTQNVTAPVTGTYAIWSRIWAPDATHNSYYLDVYSCGSTVSTTQTGAWVWVKSGTVNLPAGAQTLQLVGTMASVKVDHVLLTTDLACTPVAADGTCGTPTPTLSPTLTPKPTPTPTTTPTPVIIPADLNGDGHVNIFDLSILLTNWGKAGAGDLDKNGVVNIFDLSRLLSSWTG